MSIDVPGANSTRAFHSQNLQDHTGARYFMRQADFLATRHLYYQGKLFAAQFSYGRFEQELKNLGGLQSMSTLSFEVADGFNGSYVGMYASSNGKTSERSAGFDWFEYEGN